MEVFSSFNLKMMNFVFLDSLSAWNASAHDGSTATPERDFLLDHRHRVEGDTIFLFLLSMEHVICGMRMTRKRRKQVTTNASLGGLEFGRETNQKFFFCLQILCVAKLSRRAGQDRNQALQFPPRGCNEYLRTTDQTCYQKPAMSELSNARAN